MEISKQIKKYRAEAKLSQEELADRIFVTRQTISNWENDKNYPDIHSLALLGALFGVSLDILVKGDLEQMEQEIKTEDIKKLNRDSKIYAILLVATVLLIVPLFFFADIWGVVLWLCIYGTALYYAFRIEKQKKKHDIQTYKEILAFSKGQQLDQVQQHREQGKRSYQTVLYAIGAGLITALVVWGMYQLLGPK